MQEGKGMNTEALRRFGVFDSMDDAALQRLVTMAEIKDFQIAETLVRVDEVPEHIYFILEGRVQVQIPGTGFVTLEAPDFFGESSLLEGGHFLPPGWRLRTRNATIVALSPVKTAIFQLDNLGQHIQKYPEVRSAIARIAKERSAPQPG